MSKFYRTTGLIALIFLIGSSAYGIFFRHMPFDESLFRMLVRSILREGYPVRPDGNLYTVNGPLAIYLQALPAALCGTNVVVGRLFHWLLFVGPVLLFTFLSSRRLFGRESAWLSIILLAGVAVFLRETVTAEIDMPFTLLYTLLLYLMIVRQQKERQQRRRCNLWLGTCLAALFLIKVFQGLVMIPTLGTLFLLEYRGNLKEICKNSWQIFALGFLGLALWLMWGLSYDSSILETLAFLTHAVVEGDQKYAAISAGRGVVNYMFFLASNISLPLFVAAALSLLWHRKNWRTIMPPLVWTFWVLLAIAISKIRVTRYFVPALPALAILASGIAAKQLDFVKTGWQQRTAWITGLIILLGLFIIANLFAKPLPWAGFAPEPFKLLFLIVLALVGAIAMLQPKSRSKLAVAASMVLLGSVYLFSMGAFPWQIWGEKTRSRRLTHQAVGRQAEKMLPKSTIVGVPSMDMAFAIDRDYLNIKNKYAKTILPTIKRRSVPFLILREIDIERLSTKEALRAFMAANCEPMQQLPYSFQLFQCHHEPSR